MVFVISDRHVLQRRSLYLKIFFKLRVVYNTVPFVQMLRYIVAHHFGCVCKHIRKKSAAKERAAARLYHYVISHGYRQFSHRRYMRPKRGVVRRFIMTKPRVAHKFESKFFWDIANYAVIKRAYTVDKPLNQYLKLLVGVFIFFFMRVIPFPVVVCCKFSKII